MIKCSNCLRKRSIWPLRHGKMGQIGNKLRLWGGWIPSMSIGLPCSSTPSSSFFAMSDPVAWFGVGLAWLGPIFACCPRSSQADAARRRHAWASCACWFRPACVWQPPSPPPRDACAPCDYPSICRTPDPRSPCVPCLRACARCSPRKASPRQPRPGFRSAFGPSPAAPAFAGLPCRRGPPRSSASSFAS